MLENPGNLPVSKPQTWVCVWVKTTGLMSGVSTAERSTRKQKAVKMWQRSETIRNSTMNNFNDRVFYAESLAY